MGKIAAENVLGRILRPTKRCDDVVPAEIVVKPKLIERETTGLAPRRRGIRKAVLPLRLCPIPPITTSERAEPAVDAGIALCYKRRSKSI